MRHTDRAAVEGSWGGYDPPPCEADAEQDGWQASYTKQSLVVHLC